LGSDHLGRDVCVNFIKTIFQILRNDVIDNINKFKLQVSNVYRKAPPSVVSSYDKRSIYLNKVVATFEKHIFFSQTDLTRTGIISNSYNEMFEA
jgi:hypothetical protein